MRDSDIVHQLFLIANTANSFHAVEFGPWRLYSEPWEPYHISVMYEGKSVVGFNPYVNSDLGFDPEYRPLLLELIEIFNTNDQLVETSGGI